MKAYFIKKGLFGWTQIVELTKKEVRYEEEIFRKRVVEMKKDLGYK